MKFAEPFWLLVALAACGTLVWLWRRYDAHQRAALSTFASAHLAAQLTASFSPVKQTWKRGLFLVAIACLLAALARPQAGFRWEEFKRRGIEVMFAVDTSRSMLTPDVKPDRLTRAKLAVDDFANHLDGDGMGLIAFAGNAFLQCPITLDYDAFHESLQALDTGIIPRGGTDIASAIREAQAALQNRPNKDKILVLLTDGEDLEGNAIDAAKAAAKDGLKIYTVGVGTANGELIPIPAEQGGGFVKDENGQYVKSHLDENGLKAMAAATGGLYAPLGAEGQGLDTIYREALAPLARHDLASRRQKVYTERYQWPLAASLVLLLGSTLIGTRRRNRAKQERPVPVNTRPQFAAAAAALGLLLFNPFNHAEASTLSPDQEYNQGTAAYKAGQFQQAAEAFQKSISSEPSAKPKRLAVQEDSYYDLGDTLYRNGQKTEKSNPKQTIQAWEQAVKTYEAALQLRSTDADAKYNRDFVQKKLDELKKQQQKQQQKQEQQKKQQQKQDQQNQKQNQDQQKESAQNSQKQKEQKDQKNKSEQQQANNSKPGQPKPDQQGQQPKPAEQPKPADQHKQEMAKNSEPQREPGQMSKEEARSLLDSLKDEQRRLPAAPVARNSESDQRQDQPIKDW